MPEQQQPVLNDDPALAMSMLWKADFDQLEGLCSVAAQRERIMFQVLPKDAPAARRAFQEAAGARDKLQLRLETCERGIFRTHAQSFAGAAAKLDIAIRCCAPSLTSKELPWPYLQSVLRDLERLLATNTRPEIVLGDAQHGAKGEEAAT